MPTWLGSLGVFGGFGRFCGVSGHMLAPDDLAVRWRSGPGRQVKRRWVRYQVPARVMGLGSPRRALNPVHRGGRTVRRLFAGWRSGVSSGKVGASAPPSISMTLPVTLLAAGEASHRAALPLGRLKFFSHRTTVVHRPEPQHHGLKLCRLVSGCDPNSAGLRGTDLTRLPVRGAPGRRSGIESKCREPV